MPIKSRKPPAKIDSNRGGGHQRSVQPTETVTISAADSSTDPRGTEARSISRRTNTGTDTEEEEQRNGR